MLGNITSANATIVMTVEDLFPAGVVLQQFATDQSADGDEHEYAQARMGVDGHMAAGYVPNPWNITVMLEASSPSLKVMQALAQAMRTNRRTYDVSFTITLPALGQVHTYRDGTLTAGKDMPGLKKTLDPTSWRFTFGVYNQSQI
ncbi:MAG: hypothetical protein IIX61_09530 [Loktanella sp.]|nr:hypothetical protein [Loktanella sp.]